MVFDMTMDEVRACNVSPATLTFVEKSKIYKDVYEVDTLAGINQQAVRDEKVVAAFERKQAKRQQRQNQKETRKAAMALYKDTEAWDGRRFLEIPLEI